MSNEIDVLIESLNGERLNDSILNLSEQIRIESGSSKQFDHLNWSIELLEPSKLFCRISEKPGFMEFLDEIGKLQDNLIMKYSRFDGSPEWTSEIYRNKNGEWLKSSTGDKEKFITNHSELSESHKRILLDVFENGQELIDDFKPPQNPCCKFGKESKICFEFRREMSRKKLILKDGDWIEVDNNYVDDGDYDHTEYWCETCFEKNN